ncbi:hypothetical protein MHBO_003214 [Bonamia ostreae]|uniref:Uncharacterized protein n=1 Tax=Bonamia ostreae TaxID=126728 RepID=A0ABV2AQI9_9EUKA
MNITDSDHCQKAPPLSDITCLNMYCKLPSRNKSTGKADELVATAGSRYRIQRLLMGHAVTRQGNTFTRRALRY